jgi:hypothetical protein
MRRLPHGGTTRPAMPRPGNGYGRSVKAGPSDRLQAFAVKSRTRRRDPNWLLAISLDDEVPARP